MSLFLADAEFGLSFSVIIFVLILLAIIMLSILGRFVSLWFQAIVSGTPISLFNIIGMSLRKIPSRVIVTAYINAHKAGIKAVSVAELETHVLAGGNVSNVVRALIVGDKANIALTWRQATAIDLAGRDILDAVRTSVNPKVIDCPDIKHGEYITAVAKDGIQLKVRARVTVRTNIGQLVGGATEETIIARVGEGIVARLRSDKAESDKIIAQARAEERRAMAVAMEQENIAKVTEMKAKVVEAEAQLPLAMAEAFRKGNMGILDYYRMKNIQSDTEMRKSISKGSTED